MYPTQAKHAHELAAPIHCLEREAMPPSRPCTSRLQPIAWCLLRSCLFAIHRLDVQGIDHLPAKPPYVLVANHTSHLDTAVLMSALPHTVLPSTHPIAAQDTFFKSPLRATLAKKLSNALPIRRGHADRQMIDDLRRRLIDDHSVLIVYPEGTRGSGQIPQAFLPGIGLLVAGTDVPVVPCRIRGCERALPKGKLIPRPTKLKLQIGEPRHYPHRPQCKASWLDIAAELQAAVQSL